MNIGAHFTTETGNIYIADVVAQKLMRIDANGKKSRWKAYKELVGGYVDQKLTVKWPEGKDLITTKVVKFEFPKLS